MNPNAEPPRREYTEAELKAYRAEMGRKMTAAQLMEFIDDDQPVIPAEQVLEEVDRLFRQKFPDAEPD